MLPEDGEDLYALLEVHAKASPEVIKKAYHALMQKNHPDRGGDLHLAKRINQAYDILIDEDKRLRYDQMLVRREALRAKAQEQLRRQKAAEAAEAAAALAHPDPVELSQLKGEYLAPMRWGEHILVADERGNRVVILDRKGEVVWRYGRSKGEQLSKPRLAQFTHDGLIAITDTGKQRVLKVNLKKETVWEFTYSQQGMQARTQAQPVFLHAMPSGHLLITDAGHRKVFEIDAQGKTVWEFNGKLGFSLSFQHQMIQPELFMPVSAFEIEPGRFLIADQGNGRILELNRKGKLLWMYPDKKHPGLQAINFACRLPAGSTWLTSDKIIEISVKGEMLWHYARLEDADIKQAYPLADSSFIVDFAHLVKRGINQEVMMLDHNSKILYRHYYSQHRFL